MRCSSNISFYEAHRYNDANHDSKNGSDYQTYDAVVSTK